MTRSMSRVARYSPKKIPISSGERPDALRLGNANGIEVALVGEVPAAVERVNGEAVALGPVAVELANHVVAARVVVLGLKILHLEKTVLVSKSHLLGHGLGAGLTNAEDRIIVDRSREHAWLDWEGGAVTCDHVRDAIHHDRLLDHVLGLTGHHHRLARGLLDDDWVEASGSRSSQHGAALDLGGNDSAMGL